MTEFSDHVNYDEGAPILDTDGETILVPLSGRTAGGAHYDGVRQIRPGEPDYNDLLPRAQTNPKPVIRRTRKPDPEALERIRRDAGLE